MKARFPSRLLWGLVTVFVVTVRGKKKDVFQINKGEKMSTLMEFGPIWKLVFQCWRQLTNFFAQFPNRISSLADRPPLWPSRSFIEWLCTYSLIIGSDHGKGNYEISLKALKPGLLAGTRLRRWNLGTCVLLILRCHHLHLFLLCMAKKWSRSLSYGQPDPL